MTRRALAGFILINLIVSVAVVITIILIWNATQDQEPIIRTRVRIVTATGEAVAANTTLGFAPREADLQTITALERQGTVQAQQLGTLQAIAATAGYQPATEIPVSPFVPNTGGIPTLDPTVFSVVTLPSSAGGVSGSGGGTSPTSVAASDGCIRHVIQSGDTCSAIAADFGIDITALIELNGIDAACRGLIPGQELRIPGPNCQPPPTITPTPTVTRTAFVIGTFTVTNTPAPTAASAQVEIVQVLNFGDVTTEQLDIRNTSNAVVDILGWTLEDENGNVFTFPDTKLQPSQVIRIFTRIGQDTPGALYWDLTVPVWQAGEVATLFNTNRVPQSVYTVGGQTITFGN